MCDMSVIFSLLAETVESFLKHIGKLWYLVSPKETTFEFPHEVPDYQQQVMSHQYKRKIKRKENAYSRKSFC